jgi:galactose oxidase
VRTSHKVGRHYLPLCALAVLALWPSAAGAQIREIVVGVTPNCPYGIKACWSGAYEALGRLEGVESVAAVPDAYNCTASIRLKGKGLPDPKKWADQFVAAVDKSHVFRGVEVTVEGTLEKAQDGLAVRIPGMDAPLRLAHLQHKLQWNFKKSAARQPEPDEKDAYEALATAKDAKGGAGKVNVTGPLRKEGNGYVVEVREFTRLDRGK